MRPSHVSVVVPTRDRWQQLAKASLPSALVQEGVELEVIVVDDGSTERPDRSGLLGDGRVRLVRHESPRGVAAARNTGLDAALGDVVAFLDDDDLWAPQKLRVQLEALRAADAGFAYCGVIVVDEDHVPTHVLPAPAAADVYARLLRANVVPAGSSNVLCSAALLRSVGGFDEQLGYLADWDLWIRLAARSGAVACADLLVAYVRHRVGMRFDPAEAVRELEHLRRKHRHLGIEPDPGRFMAWVAAEHRQAGRRGAAVAVYARAAFTYRRPMHLARVAATLFDRRGAGLRNALRRRPVEEAAPPAPQWLESPR
jgi:glycosyltransferase involved in cell wall biosynthesis